MGDVISFSFSAEEEGAGAGESEPEAGRVLETGAMAAAGSATGALKVVVTVGSAPRFNVILNPSCSSLKTARSFFLMSAISSLMSFKSKVSGVVWVASGCYGLEKNGSKRGFSAEVGSGAGAA